MRHRVKALADLSNPLVGFQGALAAHRSFIQTFGGDLDGVLNAFHVTAGNAADSDDAGDGSVSPATSK